MDYETPDGSHFSLREIWTDGAREAEPTFRYTTISAHVDGRALYGRVDRAVADVDEGDVLGALIPVPAGAIHPCVEEAFTRAPPLDRSRHYLKAPSFTWDDCQDGETGVAENLRREIGVLERLRRRPHPNVVVYHGCVVRDGEVTHVCLERCRCNLVDWVDELDGDVDIEGLMKGVGAGVRHLHALGLVHNDISPYNVCVTDSGRPVLVDFDSCAALGHKVIKGVVRSDVLDGLSCKENDLRALDALEDWLVDACRERCVATRKRNPD